MVRALASARDAMAPHDVMADCPSQNRVRVASARVSYYQPNMLRPGPAIVFGGLAVAVLDGLDALIFFGLRGATPSRVFQGVAAGLLGRAAFDGGMSTTALGLGLHTFIAIAIVATYFVVSRRARLLTRRPVL